MFPQMSQISSVKDIENKHDVYRDKYYIKQSFRNELQVDN